uniref:Uncharacterized protein n=1 Tax=Anguilla anguilla TaxID=7936 RepID=A0A0E9SH09_ANGAN
MRWTELNCQRTVLFSVFRTRQSGSL